MRMNEGIRVRKVGGVLELEGNGGEGLKWKGLKWVRLLDGLGGWRKGSG